MRPSKVHVYISVLKLMLRVFDVKCKGYPVKNQMNISTPIKQEGSGDDEMLIMYYEIWILNAMYNAIFPTRDFHSKEASNYDY